jgi:hypothetical protein
MLKTVSSITNALGALNYKGTWNASTNTPALTSGAGTKGDYYVVSVAGSTTLDGISNWGIGDWAAFNGSVWQRVEGGADLNGVNLSVSGTSTLSGLTASTALALDASKNVVSVTNTGTGNNVLASSPTLVTPKGVQGSLTLGPGSGVDFKSGGSFMAFATFPVAVTITGIDFQYVQANQDNIIEVFQYIVSGSSAVTLATYTGTPAGTRSLRTTGLTIAVSAGTRFFVGPNTSSNGNQANINVAIEYTTA